MHRCAITMIQSTKRCACQIRLFFNLWFNYSYLLPYIFTFSDFCTWHLGSLQYTSSCSRQFRGRTNSSSNVPCAVTRQPWCAFMSHVSFGVVRPVVIPYSNTKDTPYAAVWNSQIGEYFTATYWPVLLTILLGVVRPVVIPYSNTKDTPYAAVWNSQFGEYFTATYWPVPITILLGVVRPVVYYPLQQCQRHPLCFCMKQSYRWVLYCYFLTRSPYSTWTSYSHVHSKHHGHFVCDA